MVYSMCQNRGDTLPDIWSSEFLAILILNQAIHEVPRGDEHGQLQREDVDTRSDWLFAPHDVRPKTEVQYPVVTFKHNGRKMI